MALSTPTHPYPAAGRVPSPDAADCPDGEAADVDGRTDGPALATWTLRAGTFALVGFPLLLHLPIFLKNYWDSGKLDLLVLLPAWVFIVLWLRRELLPAGSPLAASIRARGGALCARLRDPLAWFLLAWMAIYTLGIWRVLSYHPDHPGSYGHLTAAAESLRLATYLVLGTAALRTFGIGRSLLLLTYGMGLWVAANWVLHWCGLGNEMINLGRGHDPTTTTVGACRLLGYVGITCPTVKFPIGEPYAPIGLPFGLTAAFAWHQVWARIPTGRRLLCAGIFIAAFAALMTSDRQAAFVATCLALVLPFALPGRYRRLWIALPALAVVVLLIGVISAPQVASAYKAGEIGPTLYKLISASNRTPIWHFYLTHSIPNEVDLLVGHGFYGHYAFDWRPLQPLLQNSSILDSHNQFLDVVVNNGLVGLAAFLGLLHLALWRTVRNGYPAQRLAIAFFVAFVITGICEETFNVHQSLATCLFLLFALSVWLPPLPAHRNLEQSTTQALSQSIGAEGASRHARPAR